MRAMLDLLASASLSESGWGMPIVLVWNGAIVVVLISPPVGRLRLEDAHHHTDQPAES
jgi:hypothetical protein